MRACLGGVRVAVHVVEDEAAVVAHPRTFLSGLKECGAHAGAVLERASADVARATIDARRFGTPRLMTQRLARVGRPTARIACPAAEGTEIGGVATVVVTHKRSRRSKRSRHKRSKRSGNNRLQLGDHGPTQVIVHVVVAYRKPIDDASSLWVTVAFTAMRAVVNVQRAALFAVRGHGVPREGRVAVSAVELAGHDGKRMSN